MPEYAVLKDNDIINVIVADSSVDAEVVTNLSVIEINNGIPSIGWFTTADGWRPPYPNNEDLWIWDEVKSEWVSEGPIQ